MATVCEAFAGLAQAIALRRVIESNRHLYIVLFVGGAQES